MRAEWRFGRFLRGVVWRGKKATCGATNFTPEAEGRGGLKPLLTGGWGKKKSAEERRKLG